jgi:antirestriction protein
MTTPQIYVGTYAKYNNGSIEGAWLDLTNYSDKNEFYVACAALHSDEEDPEYMFQDWEGIQDQFISECHIDEKFWEFQELTTDWDEDRISAFQLWIDHTGSSDSISEQIENFEESYRGIYDCERAYAEELAEELGYISAMEKSGISVNYFDFEQFANDLFISDVWGDHDAINRFHVFIHN